MTLKEKVIVCWSGGKDSALALYELLKNGEYEVAILLTTITQDYNRISMHGVREDLLTQQAQLLGFALEKVYIPKDGSQRQYESEMRKVLEKYFSAGVESVVFGDIFLADLRKQREDNLAEIKMKAIFPIWGKNTALLAREFIDFGFKAVITCVDTNFLDENFVARDFDKKFLSELPAGVDPCGENGEFHTFVYDGPIFRNKISFETGQVVLRENRFYFCDLIPVSDKRLSPAPKPV